MGDDLVDMGRLRASCSRSLTWHWNRTAGEMLGDIDPGVEIDRYGEGGVVAELEEAVADLLGFPAAMFAPSGTMVQQIALRIHAERVGCRTVAWHPTSHLGLHELDAASRLHHLDARPLGDARTLLTVDDLTSVAEPVAAVLFELPQREIGGQLPAWDDLREQIDVVHERGWVAHLDGARLWEAGAGYERPYREVAGLFDSVYVSFYKGLGGLAGCCLLGDENFTAQAREWRSRHGGTLFALWPYAAAALAGLRTRLPRMEAYRDHARAIAAALRDHPAIEVVPDPPHISMMHLHVRGNADAMKAAMIRLAVEESIWTWPGTAPTDSPTHRKVELSVGDATMEWSPQEVVTILDRLLEDAASR